MYKHILVPTDGSELCEKAISAAIDFARETGARLTAFTAMPEYQMPGEAELMSSTRVVTTPFEYERQAKQQAEAILDAIAARARDAGVEFDADYELNDRPDDAIIKAAQKHGCDLIFMASHGRRGISKLIHGSETQGVLTHSTIPTLVYR